MQPTGRCCSADTNLPFSCANCFRRSTFSPGQQRGSDSRLDPVSLTLSHIFSSYHRQLNRLCASMILPHLRSCPSTFSHESCQSRMASRQQNQQAAVPANKACASGPQSALHHPSFLSQSQMPAAASQYEDIQPSRHASTNARLKVTLGIPGHIQKE